MNYANYDSVVAQLRALGLRPQMPLEFNKRLRCPVEGRRSRPGWYHLYNDLLIDDKSTPGLKLILITGSFGVFQGADQTIEKIAISKADLPQVSKEERAQNARRHAESAKRAKAEEAARHTKAALRAQSVWRKCQRTGESDYITKKLIRGDDVRYTPTNAIVIPIHDTANYIWGLQFILDKTQHKAKIEKRDGNNKECWPPGLQLKGHFYQIGPMITTLALVCEGWATGESLHMATGLPVIVVFAAFNYEHVLKELIAYHENANFLLCVDDDDLAACGHCEAKIQISQSQDGTCPECGQPHKKKNTGVEAGIKASTDARIHWVRPKWPDKANRLERYKKNKGKITDYNDLHNLASLSVVREQISNVLKHKAWLGGTVARVAQTGGEGEEEYQENLKIHTVAEALDRMWLIYGTSLVFDEKHKMIYTLSAFYDTCASREITSQWRESAFRKKVMLEHIGFDPAGEDKNIVCNLWDAWPTEPMQGDCDLILDLLLYMCSGEKNPADLAEWVIKWLAYPIQNPGAKMQTAVVIYGPQGTGKNLLADAIKQIYGKYGATINQRALETQFNDFLSKKLFIVANEIASSSEKYEMKNALKTFITDDQIWINPKGVAAYFEQNHVNILFNSNERQPVVLEHDDRRHCVIWTPPPKTEQYYKQVAQQIKNGGTAALHHYLLTIDLGDFNEYSRPPMTEAKQELIDLGKPPVMRFHDEWISGEIDGAPNVPVQKHHIYKFFRYWCLKTGHRASSEGHVIDRLSKLPGVSYERRRIVKESPTGQTVSQTRVFRLTGCEEQPFSFNNEANWIADCARRMESFLDTYKGD